MRIIIGFIVLFFSQICYAQSSYQAGLLPSFNLTKKLPADFKINFKVESRQELKSGIFATKSPIDYEYLLTDFAFVASKKIDINKSLAVGYLLRIKDKKVINRSIQQLIITKKYHAFRLSHRVSADQTFEQEKDTEFRLRYRLSSQIPLNGQAVDPNEFYLKLNNEYLNSWQGPAYDLELRVVPFIGYAFQNNKKLELGLDYRLDSFLEGGSRHRFWFGFNWYQGI